MAEPYMSEIKIFSFNFPPKGWAFCNGQQLEIGQNQALFALLGTTFGGDGRSTFALPNLQGRTPVHFGNGHTIGEQGGQETNTLTINQLPTHNHIMKAADAGPATNSPNAHSLSSSKPANQYVSQPVNPVVLASASVANVGGSQPHSNMQPYAVINFCIALIGNFPSQN